MNYRHAFHAGNFADCFKHALLVALLDTFGRKQTPYFVLDTHGGAGRYNLNTENALRTGEAEAGIRRLRQRPSAVLARYLELVEQLGLYPGSPTLIRAVLRETDRLACCELHPEDARTLRRQFHRDSQVEIHERSGWEALRALLPPPERRGLVFIDPPFEAKDEYARTLQGVLQGHARFRHGVFAAWYPIKQMAAVRNFHANVISSGLRDVVAIELRLRETTNANRLSGCGLVVVNPPYRFEDHAQSIANEILVGLGDGEVGSGTVGVRLADE